MKQLESFWVQKNLNHFYKRKLNCGKKRGFLLKKVRNKR